LRKLICRVATRTRTAPDGTVRIYQDRSANEAYGLNFDRHGLATRKGLDFLPLLAQAYPRATPIILLDELYASRFKDAANR